MKKLLFMLAAATVLLACSNQPSNDNYVTSWHWDEGTIVVESPAMPEGQQTALQLTVEPIPVVHIGFVGLGMRGPDAVERYCYIPGVEIVALCDYDSARVENAQSILTAHHLPRAEAYWGEEGYQALCQREDIDLVYIATDWDHHFPVAVCGLTNNKNVAIEVPAALNLNQIWKLINLTEQTRKHCVILENCCYDFFEMNTLNMAQQGVFGEILRVEGAYIHCLDPYWEQYWHNPDGSDPDNLHWRLKYNMEHRGDIYATHGLGPVAQLLNIHRGDRFKTLVAMDTKSVHGREMVEAKTGQTCENFLNGDHTTTLIRTELGKVIEIQHNVMNPQPYNRLYKLTGTNGYATKYPEEHYALNSEDLAQMGVKAEDDLSGHEFMGMKDHNALVKKYVHPIIAEYGKKAKEVGGHGGMDFIMDCRLIYCLQNGLPMDEDIYDLAEWCCLGELGALSMDHNCAPVAVPDFTRGHWNDIQGFKHAQ